MADSGISESRRSSPHLGVRLKLFECGSKAVRLGRRVFVQSVALC